MKLQRRQVNSAYFKRYFFGVLLAGTYSLCISNTATAQAVSAIREQLQEFFIAQPVYPQHKNEIQFTTKPTYWKIQGSEITNFPLQVEYGLTNRFQIELELPYGSSHAITGERLRGMGNAEIGFLYNILKGTNPFAMSFAMEVGLPTEKRLKGVERRKVAWEPSLIVANQIGRAQVHASLGAELVRGQSAYNYNLATVYPLGSWRATLELNGEIEEENLLYLTPGLIWKGLDDFEFGVGIPKGLIKNNASWGIILMITHEFSFTRQEKQHD